MLTFFFTCVVSEVLKCQGLVKIWFVSVVDMEITRFSVNQSELLFSVCHLNLPPGSV